jgi:hypothetical protein
MDVHNIQADSKLFSIIWSQSIAEIEDPCEGGYMCGRPITTICARPYVSCTSLREITLDLQVRISLSNVSFTSTSCQCSQCEKSVRGVIYVLTIRLIWGRLSCALMWGYDSTVNSTHHLHQ